MGQADGGGLDREIANDEIREKKIGVEILSPHTSSWFGLVINLMEVRSERKDLQVNLKAQWSHFTVVFCTIGLHSEIFQCTLFSLNAHQAGHQPQKSEN